MVAVRAFRADIQEQVHLRRRHQLHGGGRIEGGDVHALRNAGYRQHVHGVLVARKALGALRGAAASVGGEGSRLRHEGFTRFFLFLAKKSRSSAAHSSSSTRGVTSNVWLRRSSAFTLYSVPSAPAFGSAAPYTQRSTRA